MRTFLTVSVGARPQDARPLFASDDPGLVDVVVAALLDRLASTPDEGRDVSLALRQRGLRALDTPSDTARCAPIAEVRR